MVAVGAFEAKTHLSALLDQVAAGEPVVITRRGRAVARLVPVANTADAAADTIARLKALRAGVRIGSDWATLRDDGRR
jgi:prevent-host-death family protein